MYKKVLIYFLPVHLLRKTNASFLSIEKDTHTHKKINPPTSFSHLLPNSWKPPVYLFSPPTYLKDTALHLIKLCKISSSPASEELECSFWRSVIKPVSWKAHTKTKPKPFGQINCILLLFSCTISPPDGGCPHSLLSLSRRPAMELRWRKKTPTFEHLIQNGRQAENLK